MTDEEHLIFDPETIVPPPIGGVSAKINKHLCQIIFWDEKAFGWSQEDRKSSFREFVQVEIADKLSKTRNPQLREVELGSKAVHLFKKAEQKAGEVPNLKQLAKEVAKKADR